MTDIVIYGCGGFGREVLQVIHSINSISPKWRCLGFCVDKGLDHPQTVHDLPVVEDIEELRQSDDLSVVVAVGAPGKKREIVDRLPTTLGYSFPNLVHPQSWIGDRVKLSQGVVVCAGAALTTDIVVEQHVHINLTVTIGHDVRIGAFSTISPGANISGNVSLGRCVDIGTGASIVQSLQIGQNSVVGAGAAVVKSIPANCTAVGVPARIIKGME